MHLSAWSGSQCFPLKHVLCLLFPTSSFCKLGMAAWVCQYSRHQTLGISSPGYDASRFSSSSLLSPNLTISPEYKPVWQLCSSLQGFQTVPALLRHSFGLFSVATPMEYPSRWGDAGTLGLPVRLNYIKEHTGPLEWVLS